MGNNTKHLNDAKRNKNDEFYTQLKDIENELKYYKQHFENKIVLCNCDDPYESNFFKYFALYFNQLKLKKLIATCYNPSEIVGTQLTLFDSKGVEITRDTKKAFKIEINEVKDMNDDGAINLSDVELLLQNDKNTLEQLKGNGDFRSDECIKLLKKADIVVTNPPFSLFRDYLHTLIEYDKKFIIIGNLQAVKYKDVFPLIMEKKLWFGATYFEGGAAFFIAQKDLFDENKISNPKNAFEKDGIFYWRVNGVRWYTNLDHKKRHESIPLYKKYVGHENDFEKYDNFDAIHVVVKDIPDDYDGLISVPISFMDKYCPEQFEIIGELNHGCDNEYDLAKPILNGKDQFARILIRRKR